MGRALQAFFGAVSLPPGLAGREAHSAKERLERTTHRRLCIDSQTQPS